jgi:DNA repair protein RadC
MGRRKPTAEDLFELGSDEARGDEEPHYKSHRQRLRQRFLKSDPESFDDYELLELLLFHSIERVDVKPLAKQLLRDFKSFGGVLAADEEQLTRYPRINERTAAHFKAVREAARRVLRAEIADRPVISSWTQLIDYCRASMADERTERFRILYLDRKNKLIADEIQQRGTVDHTPVYPREVIKRALEVGATALILVHNHPSGDPTPSRADIEMTHEVRDAADKLGIAVYDHVIVGKGTTSSFKALGLL